MTNFSDLSNTMADAVEAVSKSIVSVRAERPISGTVVGDGLVLTVAHVLHGDEVTVMTHDGREMSATVAGRDPSSDLALLKVDGLKLSALSASEGLRVGELLLAVGRPQHGVQATLGMMERQATANPAEGDAPERGQRSSGWLPSGAAPFRGVSGGALIDARGGLVGVLNAGVSRGELLAVPAGRAMKVADLLGRTGRVPRGYLGIATQPVMFPAKEKEEASTETQPPRGGRSQGREGRGREGWGGGRGRGGWERGTWGGRGRWDQGGRVGLTVVSVEEGSPAAQAGLLVGDVLLSLDHEAVRRPPELLWRIRERAGQSLSARILRGGQEQDVTLVVGER
ncbi:S1C family serine protease [Deinococcus frigens]|uniref:S1C family serine protease n=1 Tax=Deinococcus frigens TaxID=249403 RepID=UPI001FE1963A|nr:trypsin-like peptidase domain-containing protein [Deinococcus frigens]